MAICRQRLKSLYDEWPTPIDKAALRAPRLYARPGGELNSLSYSIFRFVCVALLWEEVARTVPSTTKFILSVKR
jgi:hypothetical protein